MLSTVAPYLMVVTFPLLFVGVYKGILVNSNTGINAIIHKEAETGGLSKSNNGLRGSDSPLDTSSSLSSAVVLNNVDGRTNIPSCAKDVFVTLHKEIGGNDDDDDMDCKGMLLRDDIILTTSECSTYNFTFDFVSPQQAMKLLEAHPHEELNSKVVIKNNSRLGFLKVDSPPHYYFIDQPVHRARMFLSLWSIDSSTGEAVAFTCDDDDMKPIAHNFPGKNLDGSGEIMMIPLHDLYGEVPDDILWEHSDRHSAPTLQYNSQRWWSKAISLEEEEKMMHNLYVEQYSGPIKGSLSNREWKEVLDPRGHRGWGSKCKSFSQYYKLWRRQPFSGAHFYDWLDFGGGTSIL